MKNKHVQRGITNYTKAQKKETLGRTVRIRKLDEDPNAVTTARQRGQTAASFQDKLRYFFVFIGVAIVIAMTAVIVSQVKNAKDAVEFVSEEDEVFEVKHPTEKQAIEIAKRFLEATEITQWAGIASGDQEEIPMAFSMLYGKKKDGWKFKDIQHIGPRQISDRFVDSLLVSDNFGKSMMVNLVHLDETWKVDPGSSLQAHSKEWMEFFEPNSTTGRVRILLTDNSNYYNGIYDDESVWHAYTLMCQPDLPAIVGYVKRDSSCDLALQHLLKQTASVACVLNLHRDVSAEKAQYEIENVVSADWVVSELIFSDQFFDQSVSAKQPILPKP